jgi:hypothetical protein
VEEDGKVLIYEGHDQPQVRGGPSPKTLDQVERTPAGALTQNGLFVRAASRHRAEGTPAERVRVYEKMRTGIWVFNGVFSLVDSWTEASNGRRVFKFRLEVDPEATPTADRRESEVEQNRLIPTAVKLQVWKRDSGKCVECGSTDNLPLRPHHPLLTRRLFSCRREHPAPLRPAQPRQARPDRIAAAHLVPARASGSSED